MSRVRGPMVWFGGALATGGLLGAILRLVGAHQGIPFLGLMGMVPYYGATVGAGFIGVLIVVIAPTPRRSSNRVRLDERPVQEEMRLRPKEQAIPHTHGLTDPATHAPRSANGRPPTSHAANQGATNGAGRDADAPPGGPAAPAPAPPRDAPVVTAPIGGGSRTESSDGQGGPPPVARQPSERRPSVKPTAPDQPPTPSDAHNGTPNTQGLDDRRPAWGTPRQGHPNDHGLDDVGRTGGGPDAGPSGDMPPSERSPAAGHRAEFDPEESATRLQARRAELMARLERLEVKANQAKVRYGLGKVSAAGYRQYLAEVDRERMMIESELMETEEAL